MRDLKRFVRLIATLVYGLGAFSLLAYVAATMAGRFLQVEAERVLRRTFDEPSAEVVQRTDLVWCTPPAGESASEVRCDPESVREGRALRSARCSRPDLGSLLTNRWSCAAHFADGSTLPSEVSLGVRWNDVRLLLPLREPSFETSDYVL